MNRLLIALLLSICLSACDNNDRSAPAGSTGEQETSPVEEAEKPFTEYGPEMWATQAPGAETGGKADPSGLVRLSDLGSPSAKYLPSDTTAEKKDEATLREEARVLLEQAGRGDANARFALGYRYHTGEGVSKDEEAATRWWRMAAEQGHTSAMHNLASAYYAGNGVSKDLYLALKWYRKAADSGHRMSGQPANEVYRELLKDPAPTLRLAEDNDREAQFYLGNHYRKGEKIDRDMAEALHWYHRAADQGHAGAQYNLGIMYLTGDGVKQSDMGSLKWLEAAADQDHQKAIETLQRLGERD